MSHHVNQGMCWYHKLCQFQTSLEGKLRQLQTSLEGPPQDGGALAGTETYWALLSLSATAPTWGPIWGKGSPFGPHFFYFRLKNV